MKKRNGLYEMTPEDLAVLEASASDPNIFFDHFFRKPHQEHGWQLDYDFDEESKWQKSMVMATQKFIVAICGIATGKTLGVIMGAAYFGVLTPDFGFMNVAKEVYQSMLMYKAFLAQAKNTLFEKLIVRQPQRPYPRVEIAFKIGDEVRTSTFEFMSLGEKGLSTNIFSYRGDWINVEEAGLIPNLLDVVGNLVTRLTGVTSEGRSYLGRLSVISNPWDDPDLWSLFDIAVADKENGLAFNIDTGANHNVTEEQVKLAIELIPEKDRSRLLTGGRPEGKGIFFSRESVAACENASLDLKIREMIAHPAEGWNIIQDDNLGVWLLQEPRIEGHIYMEVGDPGVGAAPRRNAPTLIVFDVTDAPDYCPIVAFWWGNGGGSIFPFVDKLIYWIDMYFPILACVDNTGPQKNSAELITAHYIVGEHKSVAAITGMDFSNTKKYAYLGALRLCLGEHMFSWSRLLKGISSQLKKYDPIKDTGADAKLAQDIVSVMAMGAYAIRAYYPQRSQPDDTSTGDGKNEARQSIIRYSRGGSNREGEGEASLRSNR